MSIPCPSRTPLDEHSWDWNPQGTAAACKKCDSTRVVNQGASREIGDASIETIRSICVLFNDTVLSDLKALIAVLQSPLLVKIPVCRCVEEGTDLIFTSSSSFARHSTKEARILVNRYIAFSDRCRDFHFGMSEKSVFACVSEITGMMWKMLASVAQWVPVFQHYYNKKDKTGATEGNARPNETDYVNDFLICKSEYKDLNLSEAVTELKSKLARYNNVNYGPVIIFLPVIAAAGSTIELGIIDVRVGSYHHVRRYDVWTNMVQREECFVGMINCFRLFCTMLPYVPTDCTPLFRELGNVTFLVDHVKKKIPHSCTCPSQLYSLLQSNSVPCAVKVVQSRNKSYLNVSPVGLAIHDRGEELNLADVRRAVKAVLVCLTFLHGRGFVHRDIRWSNIIRVPVLRQNATLERFDYLVIDFEFAAHHGDIIIIEEYKHADLVPTGSRYENKHDLNLVGSLLYAWESASREPLDALAHNLADALANDRLTADAALQHSWFEGV